MEPTVIKDRNSNIVYTSLWVEGILAAGSVIATFIIRNPGRYMQIKSVNIDWRMNFAASNLLLPQETNTTQVFQLRMYHPTNEKITRMFIPTGGAAPTTNGEEIRFTKPGQTIFHSFFIANDLEFSLSITNLEAALSVNHIVSLAVETIEHRIS